MRVYVVSDAHLTGPGDPAQADFVRFVDNADCERIVLAGDVFDAWWGWPTVQTIYAEVVEALARAHRRGVALTLLPGNHDFAVGPVLGRWVEEQSEWSCHAAGRRWLVVHGDEPDQTMGYRLTRRVVRGRPFAAVMRGLGPRRGDALLNRLAGNSRAHMHAAAPLVDAQRRWAEQRLSMGHDAVCMGHSHALGVSRTAAGDVVHLGDWAEQRCWLTLEESTATLRSGWGTHPKTVFSW